MSRVQCPYCHRHVHPRLWHYTPWYGEFAHMKTQHICNLCGKVMYETGGGLRIIKTTIVGMIFMPILLMVVSSLLSTIGYGKVFRALFGLLIWPLLFYLLYRLMRVIGSKRAQTTPASDMQPHSGPAAVALEKLAVFKERGLLTQEEFEQEKRKILRR